ncbi:MAG: c-type cytochrome [Verrucomicrobia bacterium]|nr:c-type cytochrome [Verrucomicrobiota bacterium]
MSILARIRFPVLSFAALSVIAAVMRPTPLSAAKDPPLRVMTPDEALAAFQIEPGLRIELVAAEPMVDDPVAFAWDEKRRLYVVENRGYPDPLQTNSKPNEPWTTKGRIALLEDTNGDGRYDKRTTFAEGLGYPNGIMVWRGGVFVTSAPDLLYLKDNDGDGVADERRVVLTGFETSKTAQIRMCYPTLGLDGWIYVAGGRNGGKVHSPEHPSRPVVEFPPGDSRFHPDTLLFELVGGNSQFGLTIDDFGRRYGLVNREPVMHTVLEPHHLKRNPYLAFNASIHAVSKVQAEAKVFPISQAKTASYWGQMFRPDPKRVGHEGTFTSACGHHIFGGTALTPEHVGNFFICEPAQNLIQRQVMRPDGASFISEVPYTGREFLASPDIGFRPVYLRNGPDGALYIADMYRQEIDHPQYVPEQARLLLDFTGPHGTGRIWRVVKDVKTSPRTMPGTTVAELCRDLASPDSWWRNTARRLLLERADPACVPLLEKGVSDAPLAATRSLALWTLQVLQRLSPAMITAALRDRDPGVREQGLWLAEKRAAQSGEIVASLLPMAQDADARVRFVAALVLGGLEDSRVVAALASIAVRDGGDRWTRAAVLSGIGRRMDEFFSALNRSRAANPAGFAAVMEDLSRIFGAGASPESCRRFLSGMLAEDRELAWCLPAVLSLAEGVRGRTDLGAKKGDSPLAALLTGSGAAAGALSLDDLFGRAATVARNEEAATRERVSAVSLLGASDFARAGALLGDLLDARQPPALQLQAVRALERLGDPRGGELLVEPKHWTRYTPQIRAAVVSTMTSKPALAGVMFAAIERGTVKASEIPSNRRTQLLKHSDAKVRAGAEAAFKKLEGGDRMQVYQAHRDILKQPVNVAKGADPFMRVCSACHTYNGVGGKVGPDLAGVRNQSDEALLLHVLVPNHEISPGYEAVSVTTRDGRTLSGWLASESENSLTLRTAFDTEEIVARSNISSFVASGVSLMPDGLEQTMTKEELANIIAYLRQEPGAAGPAAGPRR